MRILKLHIIDAKTDLDLDELKAGNSACCETARIDGRDYLVVSKPYTIALPDSVPVKPKKECLVAPLPLTPRADGLVVCARAVTNQENDRTIFDMGFTFDGDKSEFGRHFLWNPETGRIDVSEEVSK